MNKNLNYIFGMYIPETDSVLVNLSNNITIELSCQKCHSNLVLEKPSNIAYLYDLAEQNPLTYTKLAFKENGLQDYMDAIEEFN